MTRKVTPKTHSLRVIAQLFGVLTVLVAVAAPAQTSGTGSRSRMPSVVPVSPNVSARLLAQEHPLLLGAGNAERALANHLHRIGASARVMDPENPLFLPAVPYGSGGSDASSIVAADLNGDGRVDLAVTNANSNTVGVLLGKGDGTFQTVVTYDSGGDFPSWVAQGDVNGDGKPDLVVANYNSTMLGVLLGNGDGTFQPVVTYASGGYLSWSAALADVNGDGTLDLLVANQCASSTNCLNSTVGVLLGNGDGTYQTAVTYDSGGNQALSVAVRDVSADGKPDLMVANWGSSTVGVLLGNGDGTFHAAATYGSGGSGDESVAVADVNGDGKLDLLVANDNDSSGNTGVGVLLGNGNGTFQSAVTYGSGGKNSATSIAVADVNGDNKLDLLVANVCASAGDCANGIVGVLLGNGDGTFEAAAAYGSGGFAARWVAVGDLNADGRPDLLVANCGMSSCADGGVVGVLLNSVGEIPTTTTLASSLNPSVFGQVVTFTAVVRSSSGSPTGTVNFFDGTTALGSATLVKRKASLSVSLPAAGSRSITAVYQGSPKFNSSSSAPLGQVVNPAMTTTSLSSSQNPVALNQIVAYTATVASQYGGAVTGTVMFQDGGTTVATLPLVGNQAVYTTTYTNFKKVGAHAIASTYSGDANNVGSQAAVTEYVGSFPVASKTVLTTSGSPSLIGQPVTFTATVTSANPRYGAIPDGELVAFSDGMTVLGSVALVGGTAAFTTSSLTAKTHTIKAKYVGDAIFKPSNGAVPQVVEKYPTTTTLTSSPNPSQFGQAVTFTAHVTSAGPAPTGKVKFLDGTTGIGSATLDGSGVATLTKSALAIGTHPITAQYLGDAASDKSTSSVVNQVVQ